jgi:hypothetical protein
MIDYKNYYYIYLNPQIIKYQYFKFLLLEPKYLYFLYGPRLVFYSLN